MVVLYKRNGRMLFTEYEKRTKLGCFKKKVLVSTDIDSEKAEKYFQKVKSEICSQERRDSNIMISDRKYLIRKESFYNCKPKKFRI